MFSLPDRLQRCLHPNTLVVANAKAAVVMLLQQTSLGIDVIITQRSANLRQHASQLCFPGGRIDTNETPLNAAQRELFEEIGVSYKQLHWLGQCPAQISKQGEAVAIYVAFSESILDFNVNPNEVAAIFSLPIRELNRIPDRETVRQQKNKTVILPHYDLDIGEFWGLSALIWQKFIEQVTKSDLNLLENLFNS